jgi:hypothetical protein
MYEALKLKLKKSFLILDEDITIDFYDTKQEYGFGFSDYGNYIKSLSTETTKRLDIEKSYNNKDDLLYDIYKASQYAEFFCSYEKNINSSEFGNTYILNILYPFIYNKNPPGFQTFVANLLSKQKFLEMFENDNSLFPEVLQEIENPEHILARAKINFSKKHNSNINDLNKISVFNSYVRNTIIPKMEKNIDDNEEQFIEKFGDIETAKEKMKTQILGYANSFLNPFNRDDIGFKQIDEVFMLYNLDVCDMQVYNDPKLKEELSILKNSFWTEEIVPLSRNRPAIDLNKVSKKGLRVVIYSNRSEPTQYSFLSPKSTDTPFSEIEGGKKYSSIDEYINYKLYKNYLHFEEKLIDRLLPDGRDTLLGELQRHIRNLICKNMVDCFNIWLENPKNKQLLKETAGKNITFNSDNKALKNLVGKYLMLVRQEMSETIENPAIIKWVQEKIIEFKNSINFAKNKLKAKLDSHSQILNFLNTVYKFKNINSDLKVRVDDENPTILSYLNKFIAYTLVNIDESEFEKSCIEGKDILKTIENQVSDKDKIKFVYDFAIKIRKNVLKKKGEKEPSLEELGFVLSLINNRNINIEDKYDIPKYIDDKRIAFFINTYELEAEEVKEVLGEAEEEEDLVSFEKEKEDDEEREIDEEDILDNEEKEDFPEEE